jgi:membrane protease subunit HflK
MFNEYLNFPAITRQRMYLEMIETVLPGVKVYIDDGTGTSKLLPLEPFSGTNTSGSNTTGVN